MERPPNNPPATTKGIRSRLASVFGAVALLAAASFGGILIGRSMRPSGDEATAAMPDGFQSVRELDEARAYLLQIAKMRVADLAGVEAKNRFLRRQAGQMAAMGIDVGPLQEPDPRIEFEFQRALARYRALGGSEADLTAHAARGSSSEG